MGWPKNTINVQVVQRLAVHYGWEKGPDAKSERQECPEAKGITRMVSPTYIVFQGLALGSNLAGQMGRVANNLKNCHNVTSRIAMSGM